MGKKLASLSKKIKNVSSCLRDDKAKLFAFLILLVIGLFCLGFFYLRTLKIHKDRFFEAGKSILQASLTNQPEVIKSQMPEFQESGLYLLKQLNLFKTIDENFRKSLILLPELIGLDQEDKKTYTILLQNDRELRPTGGFMGSYAQITFQKGVLLKYSIEDIYVPDGQIYGHIISPEPIQEAFQHGTWRLPNSNWDPDFPSAAKTITWFFDKGGVDIGDGLIAVNLKVLEDLFEIIGEIYIPDYQGSISSDTLYSITQEKAEKDFFPGSTQKKDFLQHLTNGLMIQSQKLDNDQILKSLALLYRHCQKRNIQFYFKNKAFQELVTGLGWSGRIKWPTLSDQFQDFLFIVDANLGANKANCCVERKVIQKIEEKENSYEVSLQIEYVNKNPTQHPNPPESWGGDYENYLRILLPEANKIESVYINDQPLSEESFTIESQSDQKTQSVGFFVNVPHLQQRQVKVKYIVPQQKGYQLFIQKQSGIDYGHTIEYSDKLMGMQTTELWVNKDQKINF